MTDIVDRLRDRLHPEYAATVIVSDTLREAAAEIERLRAENKRLRGWIAPDILELTDELERLRAAGWAVVNSSHGAGAEHWAACDGMRRALEPKP